MKLMPQEIEVRYILPALRREFAISLNKQGHKQVNIANMLNITPAAVSQYLSDKRGKMKFRSKIQKEITKAVKNVRQDKSNMQREIYRISSLIKSTPTICEIHRKYDDLPECCEICFSK